MGKSAPGRGGPINVTGTGHGKPTPKRGGEGTQLMTHLGKSTPKRGNVPWVSDTRCAGHPHQGAVTK